MRNSRCIGRQGLACALAAALAAFAACGDRARTPPPNLLVVTIDTLRADRLGCYGFGLAQTPAIDRLAAEGVRCTDAATAAPITLPAHASIMTGLYPPAHGVRDNGNYALAPAAVTLAERLSEAGYRTAAFVSAAVLARRYGLAQGFETYDDDLWSENPPELFMIRERPAARTTDRALAWLDDWTHTTPPRAPFFLWLHYFEPHQPHALSAMDLAVLAPTPYDAEIATVDRSVGRIVEWLRRAGMLDTTLVVVTADHGEGLGEHGEPTHGVFIYDATTRVPLVWRLPGVFPAGTVYDGPVRHIDLVPTVLAALALPSRGALQGTNLLEPLRGRTPPPALAQYTEARLGEEGFGLAPLAGIREGGRKLIRAPRPELYDLGTDPREARNLYADEPGLVRSLEASLDAALADSTARAIPTAANPMDRETEEMLRALGYLAPPEQRAEMAGIDPKDGMVLYVKLQEARQLAQFDRWSEATAILEDVLRQVPGNVTARNLLALAAVRREDLDEAERQYDLSLQQQPRQHRVVGALGQIALRRDDLERAEARFREALALAPEFVEAMSNLGFLAALQGDTAGAEAWYQRALAADPTYPHVHRRLGDLFYDRKDYARARGYYEQVLEVLPGHFEALVQAGNCCRFLGDVPGAVRFYGEAEHRRPDSWIPPYNLACLHALQGDAGAAMMALERAAERGLRSPALLDGNDDFATLRATPGWPRLLDRVRAAASAPRPAAVASGP